jgi:hypothetical protein
MSDDKKHLDIQFFWLSSNPYVPRVNILQVPSLPADLDQGPNFIGLFNFETRTEIRSGCEISLKTDDPVSRPLPDFSLLEMQWFLHRVTAMSGAAEPQDDFHNDDDDSYPDRSDMYTEGDWDMDRERRASKLPAYLETLPARCLEARVPAQLPGIQGFSHMVTLRGGEDGEGEDGEGGTAKETTK